jgi:hypothetical protein
MDQEDKPDFSDRHDTPRRGRSVNARAQESRPRVPDVEKHEESQDTTPIAAGKKPNVVFILADNVGYGDLGPYGGGELRGAPTPRIDQLAQGGLRLTQFLVEPACTPSRAALMTGQFNSQWPISDHCSRRRQHALSACVHDGRNVQGRRL